jgi:hypothetical protein
MPVDWVVVGLDNGGTTNNGTILGSGGRFLLDRMAELGRDATDFEFATQIPTGATPDAWQNTLEFARGFVEVGATHVILSMPANLGPDGVDAIASQIAAPLRAAG